MGKQGSLPWDIREDWNYFMETTKDGVLIMGRRCYEDFEGFAKTRKVIALSKDKSIEFPNAIKASSLQDGLAIAQKMNKTIWICGGRGIYEEALPLADELYLTAIEGNFDGDIKFPQWEEHFSKEISRHSVETGGYKLHFSIYGK